MISLKDVWICNAAARDTTKFTSVERGFLPSELEPTKIY